MRLAVTRPGRCVVQMFEFDPLVPRVLVRRRMRQRRTLASISDALITLAVTSQSAFADEDVLLFAPVDPDDLSVRELVAAEEVVRGLADDCLKEEGVADLVARERRGVAGEAIKRVLNDRGMYSAVAKRLYNVAQEHSDARITRTNEPGFESLLNAIRFLAFADALAGDGEIDARVRHQLARVEPERYAEPTRAR